MKTFSSTIELDFYGISDVIVWSEDNIVGKWTSKIPFELMTQRHYDLLLYMYLFEFTNESDYVLFNLRWV